MPEFFHVDRQGLLAAAQTITNQPLDLQDDFQTKGARAMFGEELSQWGRSMLDADPPLVLSTDTLIDRGLATPTEAEALLVSKAGRDALQAGQNRVIEGVAEAVRQLGYPDKPSRLTSVFVYAQLFEAETFRDLETPQAPIWRVSVPDIASIHRGDSEVLGIPATLTMLFFNANLYWQGHHRCDSFANSHEVLLAPPVEVLDRVA